MYTRGWDGEAYKLRQREIIEASERTKKIDNVKEFFDDFGTIIRNNIPKQFTKGTITYKYLYLSVCLSLIKSLRTGFNKKRASILDLTTIVLFGLSSEYENIVRLIFNKSLMELGNEIKDLIDESKVSEKDFNSIMGSAFDDYTTDN